MELADGAGHKLIDALQIGDRVMTLNDQQQLVATEVIMLMDVDADVDTLFLDIHTSNNKSVRVSASHLVALADGRFKFARELRPQHDTLLTYDATTQSAVAVPVATVLIERTHSYSAPLTSAGTLLANGVLVSCYAVAPNHQLAHAAMAPVRWWNTVHNALNISGSSVAKQANGLHWYPRLLHSLLSDQSWLLLG